MFPIPDSFQNKFKYHYMKHTIYQFVLCGCGFRKFFSVLIGIFCLLGIQPVFSIPVPRLQDLRDSLFSVSDSTYRQVIREGARSMSCHLTYPQGRARVLSDFENNGSELRKLDRFIRQILRDSLVFVNSVRLCGYCSIEGPYAVNERLARSRAVGFRDYLDGKYALSSHFPVEVSWVAEDWDKLRELVEGSGMSFREEVLFLIDHVGVFEGREKRLMDLKGGEPYKYMLKTLFPASRRVEITVNYDLHRIMEEKLQRRLSEEEFAAELQKERAAAEAEERRLAALARKEEAARLAAEQHVAEMTRLEAERQVAEAARLEAERQAAELARLQAEREASEAARRQAEELQRQRQASEAARMQRKDSRKLFPLVGLKTDLVAWAGVCPDFKRTTFMPNLEAEVYFAERWSVGVSALYADWAYDGGRQFWGLSAYSVEPRFWFRRDALFRGFFVGVYGEAGDFNNQRDRRDDITTLTNYTGTYWSAGLSAGYLLPLSRHWNLELSLRGGYRCADYDRYDRELPYLYYSSSDKKNEFALTGLRFSVVYRFGRGKR